jgi:very-short-patch-repair endonuclease
MRKGDKYNGYPSGIPPSPFRRGGQGGEDSPLHRVKDSASPAKVLFAREQRRNPTRAEQMLWEALRKQRLGARFRRQHPIEDFVLDFYCDESRVAIEVDGSGHEARRDYDEWRTEFLAKYGITVARVRSEEVERNLEGVLQWVRKLLGKSSPPVPPLPSAEGGDPTGRA